MLVPAVVLGALPSLGNAFISSAVGYLTQVTNSTCMFFMVLICLYSMGAAANHVQQRLDSYFDSKFPSRAVHAVRIFVPALIMSLGFILLGELLANTASAKVVALSAKFSILALIAVMGFCAGALSGVGAVVVGSVESQRLVLVWIGVSFSGLLCVGTAYCLNFAPDSSPKCVRLFFLAASVLVQICMVLLGVFHFRGHMDEAYDKATDEGTPVLGEESDKQQWTPWITCTNASMTVFLFPLLPLLCSNTLAQALVLWKLTIDFLGHLLLAILPRRWPLSFVCAASLVRVVLFVVTLFLFSKLRGPCIDTSECMRSLRWRLTFSWNMFMILGACISCLSDTCSSTASVGNETARARDRLRRNRGAYSIGICIGLVASGAVLYTLTKTEAGKGLILHNAEARRALKRMSSSAASTCPRCANPDPDFSILQQFPCGGESRSSSKSLLLFHYGANMGCAKLGAIDVQPWTAQAAYIPNWCLRFGMASGVPTSATEPAFGNLVRCEAGCVHGVVHEIPQRQFSKLDATEPGYELVELPLVIGYDGQHLFGVKAFIMKKIMTAHAPSRRYGGLVYCTAKDKVAPAYTEQLSCDLEKHEIRNLDCTKETFLPLAYQSDSSHIKRRWCFLAAFAASALIA